MTADTAAVSRRSAHRRAGPGNVTLPDTFARSAYHEQYLGLFWSSYLPNGKAFPLQGYRYTSGVWMNELDGLFRRDDEVALRKVLLAIASTSVGKQDNKPWMIEDGIKMYGSSLATLASEMEGHNGFITDSGLATAKLLSLYEILHGHDQRKRLDQVRNWHFHVSGVVGILMSRGPGGYATGFAHQLFADGRMTQISASIATRTRTVLNQPEWKTLPWKHTPKNAKDRLADIFAELVDMLADLNELRSTKPGHPKEIRRIELIRECRRLEGEWLGWGRKHAPLKSPVISPTTQASHFVDHLVSAYAMSSYWAIGIFIYATLHLTSRTHPSATHLDRTDPRICCRRIADICPTFLSPYAGSYGVHGAIFPSIISLCYLEEVDSGFISPEARAFDAIFAGGENGKLIGQFVGNMRWQLSSQGLRLFAPIDDKD